MNLALPLFTDSGIKASKRCEQYNYTFDNCQKKVKGSPKMTEFTKLSSEQLQQ